MTANRTICFYDLETTGLSSAFDQVLRFAAIRTDFQLNELDRLEIKVKLRNDIIPNAGALITNRLSLRDIEHGDTEYEALRKIHAYLNTPGTVSAGYNNLIFDNDFLRYNFYRNLLDSYTHEWKDGCGIIDIMPITAYYYYFKPGAIKWPSGKNVLRLENLNKANNLTEGMSHDAMADVEATVELSRMLKGHDIDLWEYLTSGFDKQTDLSRQKKLPAVELSSNTHHEIGAMLKLRFGYNSNCIAPIINLGGHIQYSNQNCWLRLDKIDFNIISDDFSKLKLSVVKRKAGQPDFIVSIDNSVKLLIGSDRIEMARTNLEWIKENEDVFHSFANEVRNHTYSKREGIDVDASLYTSDFFTDEEKQISTAFHKISLEGKVNLIKKMPAGRIREIAVRIMGRNSPENLDESIMNEYAESISASSNTDLQGKVRTTVDSLLSEIKKLNEQDELDVEQQDIISLLERYYADDYVMILAIKK